MQKAANLSFTTTKWSFFTVQISLPIYKYLQQRIKFPNLLTFIFTQNVREMIIIKLITATEINNPKNQN